MSVDISDLSKLSEIYKENGFVLVKNVFSDAEVDEMRAEIGKIVGELDPSQHPKSIFDTYDEQRHASDSYFLESASKISFFYEDGAVDKEGNLTVPKDRALNKIGHALHWLNPVYKKYSFDKRICAIVDSLGFLNPHIVQSMYIFKQPKIGGAVTDHIDATFLQSDPPENLFGIWIAVDEASQENGCLWFIPGSHKGPHPGYRFVRTFATDPNEKLLVFEGTKPTYDQSKFVPVPVPKGSLVLINGLVAHKSEPNTSNLSRHAYTLHVAEMEEGKQWNKRNWLQETADYKFPALFSTRSFQ
ncbi:unnamed protein product [Bursaphelenchus xylophilus]|uniref:(pine wood nematode) hypothetical protein n=1 Tax=Bursaphelenchus xylophilus TaxID=6326 RepID=A0A1I7RIR0_BURXY|nr:unnamed protein product [Bursaphelenchus xylophilus]CAG9119029.1 unnamed protein product [Bursaphelenchus xylophilus]